MDKNLITKASLIIPTSLTNEFLEIRNILAGHAKGMTLDHKLANQVINLLLCKMLDEKNSSDNDVMIFQVSEDECENQLHEKVNKLFLNVKENIALKDIFEHDEKIEISGYILKKVINILQKFNIIESKRDVIGEAFEAFIGPSLRGNSGQFFTPRNVGEMICNMLEFRDGDIVLDPACGTGGFLTQAIKTNKSLKVYGIDKDHFLAKVCAVQLFLLSDKVETCAFCEDSLSPFTEWNNETIDKIKPNSIDVIITNPPFGTKISISGEYLNQYSLAYDWKKNKKILQWEKQETLVENRPPQVLFIERCLELLKPGGKIAIVLPDGILGNQKEEYIRQYILSKADLIAIVDLPLETFMPSTSTKTSVLFLRKKDGSNVPEEIFMAIAEKCGHDRRGNAVYRDNGELEDDFSNIAIAYKKWSEINGANI